MDESHIHIRYEEGGYTVECSCKFRIVCSTQEKAVSIRYDHLTDCTGDRRR